MNDLSHAEAVLEAVSSPSGAATSPLAASWCRSALHHNLDPEARGHREPLDAGQLSRLREEHGRLLTVANPVLDMMYRSVGQTGCGVILSDRSGVILERRVPLGDADHFGDAGLVNGVSWSEDHEGTNGIGTCLVEDRPIVIHRDQHFASRNIAISCMDAPVHDPFGQLIAALDVSSCRDDHGPAMAEMIVVLVREAARRIERDLFCDHFGERRIIFLSDDNSGTALLAVDRDDLVVGASHAARALLSIDDAALSMPQPVDRLLGTARPASFGDGDRTVLRQALARAGGNASEAARSLGIGRATLYRRMARAGIRR
ncbi:MAG: Fis family transcriptional regulator [Sphingomonas taxi]|uniref:Fis family transcriptional regulator n=1 Tax=Sphingomonas taxi TaxID=1549858 RepID=A0A2W5NYT1_9SPHN|nr:MAG: Fis family transcriptional regulator [Sphingomonas taxi]